LSWPCAPRVHKRIPALSAAHAQDVQRSLRLLKFFESGYGIPADLQNL